MNGVKRGLFSNEAGSGSAPCAAAAADCERPAQMGLVQALGVFIDTIVICSCTAMLMLLAPQNLTDGLTGMNLLQTARRIRSCIYRSDPLDVQFLDIPWNLILCKIQRRLPVR